MTKECFNETATTTTTGTTSTTGDTTTSGPTSCDDITCEFGFSCDPDTLECERDPITSTTAPPCACLELGCSEGFDCNDDTCAPDPEGAEPDGCERIPCECEEDGCEEGFSCDTDSCACVEDSCACEDFGCSDGQICNTDTCACEDPCECEEFGCPELKTCAVDICACEEPTTGTCFTDDGCDEDRFCIDGQCVDDLPGCRTNEDCLQDTQYCNNTFGECENFSCTADDDCAGARVCSIEDGSGFCGLCNEATPCPDGFLCQFGSCNEDVENANCLGANPRECPDGFECQVAFEDPDDPDNSFGFCAREQDQCIDDFDPVENGVLQAHSPDDPRPVGDLDSFNAIICDPSDEYYNLSFTEGEGVIITLEYDSAPAGGQMEIELYDSIQNPIAPTVLDIEQTGRINLRIPSIPANGNYTLRVRLGVGSFTNYTVSIERIADGLCVDDTYEDNDSSTMPERLQADRIADASAIISATLCTADEDWYEIPAGDVPFIANMEFVNDDSVGVDLVYEGETLLVDRTSNVLKRISPDPETFVPGGNYLIRVYPIRNRHASEYILRFEPPPCGDRFGENSSLGDAADLAGASEINAVHCEPGFDFFALPDSAAGNGIIVDLSYETFVGNSDMDVVIVDAEGFNVPATLITNNENGQVSYIVQELPEIPAEVVEEGQPPVVPDGPHYFVRTQLTLGSEVNYTVQINSFDGLICEDDGVEENDTPDAATPLLFEESVSATFCVADDDWYTFDAGTENFSVRIEFPDGSAPVGVELLNENTPLARDLTVSPEKTLQMTDDTFVENTTYRIHVFPTNNQLNSDYTITVNPAVSAE